MWWNALDSDIVFRVRLAPSRAAAILSGFREQVARYISIGDYCYACYTGDYPTQLVQIAALKDTKSRR